MPSRPASVQIRADVDNAGTAHAQAGEGWMRHCVSQTSCVGGLLFSTIPTNELGTVGLTNTLHVTGLTCDVSRGEVPGRLVIFTFFPLFHPSSETRRETRPWPESAVRSCTPRVLPGVCRPVLQPH